ncbi:MAG: sulfatase-like hydrolase/transferase [Leptospiraceae bacterium]|nr:sulfatase-like hydrolase/transferase [Leptospiraceae bacterium]
MWKRLPFNLKLSITYLAISLGLLQAYRLLFLAVYYYRAGNSPATDILLSFLLGLRFDISTICMILGPFVFLSMIHYLNRFKLYRIIWIYLPPIILFLQMFLLVADVIYFENGNKHIGYEAYAFLGGGEFFAILWAAFQNSPITVIGGLLLTFGFIGGIIYVLGKVPYEHKFQSWPRSLGATVIFLVLIVIGVRGGLQSSPLRVTDAVYTDNHFLNVLALNGIYTAVVDLKSTSIPAKHQMEVDRAVQVVREAINYPGADFVSDKYPLLRHLKGSREGRPPNIMIVVLEGWTGKYINPITDGKVDGKLVAPHFDELLKQGLFFTHFYAPGGRTTNGLMAIAGGVPDRPGLTAVRTPQITNRFSGLGDVAQSLGYRTYFVSGNDLDFNNKRTIMAHWGYQTLIGKEEMEKEGMVQGTGGWGFSDRRILQILHEELIKLPESQPFLATIHTVTTHYPYHTPDPKFNIFDDSVQDHEYLNVYHYADWAIHDFLEEARKAPYFKNTIFLFVSDHSHHRYLNYYEDRNVPFLIYAPGRIKPGIRTEIVSQLDVFPTILGLIGKDVYFTSFGRDLFKREAGSAYFAYGNLFGWIEEPIFYVQSVEGGPGNVYTIHPPYENPGLCNAVKAELAEQCPGHYEKSRAFLNLSYYLLDQNRIFPSVRELEEIKKIQSQQHAP